MGDLNPSGVPPHIRKMMETIAPKIREDHHPTDSNSVNGYEVCACGIVLPYLDFQAHHNQEIARIMDLEQLF